VIDFRPGHRARRASLTPDDQGVMYPGIWPAWAYVVERVTRIELALSAWEAEPSCLVTGPTWQLCWSGVTVADPSLPWLVAR